VGVKLWRRLRLERMGGGGVGGDKEYCGQIRGGGKGAREVARR